MSKKPPKEARIEFYNALSQREPTALFNMFEAVIYTDMCEKSIREAYSKDKPELHVKRPNFRVLIQKQELDNWILKRTHENRKKNYKRLLKDNPGIDTYSGKPLDKSFYNK